MHLNRLAVLFALILALIGLAKAHDPLEFLMGRSKREAECLQKDIKCRVKCLTDKKLEKYNLTTAAVKDFIDCMYQADEEPCTYAFQMFICTSKAFILPQDYDASEGDVDAVEKGESLEYTAKADL